MMQVQLPSWSQLSLVMTEIWLVLAMCVVLLVPFVRRTSAALPIIAAMVGLALALLWALPLEHIHSGGGAYVFSGMLVIDPFSQFFKVLLLTFTFLIVVQWLLTSRAETHVKDIPDYLCLLLGAALGMALMASASNLLMIFLAMEMASLPSFALAGFGKRSRLATEGSLKYVLFGSVASAVGLYGMSLIYGSSGSLDLATITTAASEGMTPMLAIGLMAMFAAIAFKLSAVPLHFWCPDVFQGAPIEVTTFLSVASKGAAICLLLRVVSSFGAAAALQGTEPLVGLTTGLAILGGVTATWGNLVALHQTNIKRLLAFSSIAHAGYMIMGVSLVAVLGQTGASQAIVGAILFYLLIYMFMNLGAFTVAALIGRHTGSYDIHDYAGLIRRSPLLAVLLGLFLLSLFGMPGLGGFMGKIYLGVAMFQAAKGIAFLLIIVMFTNTVISLYYYMKPVYYMFFMQDEPAKASFTAQLAGVVLTVMCALVLLYTGLLPQSASQLTRNYATLMVARQPATPTTMHATIDRTKAAVLSR